MITQNFNCTIQELKHGGIVGGMSYHGDFNCTIQELKLRKFLVAMKDIEDFNCTIQELKLAICVSQMQTP